MSTWTVTALLLIWIHVSVSAWWMLTSCPFGWLTLLFLLFACEHAGILWKLFKTRCFQLRIQPLICLQLEIRPLTLVTCRLHQHTVSVITKSMVVPVWCILWTTPNVFILCRQRFVCTWRWLCHQPKKTTKHRSRCARWILPRRPTRTHFQGMKWKSGMHQRRDGSRTRRLTESFPASVSHEFKPRPQSL